jgi:hypothetical protein
MIIKAMGVVSIIQKIENSISNSSSSLKMTENLIPLASNVAQWQQSLFDFFESITLTPEQYNNY